jgi:hypothetical protein
VFERDPGQRGLVLLSSYPAKAPTRTDGRVVSITGGSDGLVDVSEVQGGVDSMRAPAIGAVVEGLTHYQLTDGASDAELEREGTTGLDLDVVRRRALFVIDALREDVETAFDPGRWPSGLVPLTPAPESP